MHPIIYDEMLEQENTHWWFLSRRAILTSLLSSLKLPTNATILDAGCGSGGNLAMLSKLGRTHAFELNDKARAHAITRNLATIEPGQLPGSIPFSGTNFDLIGLFDVLEHVQNDQAALSALAVRLTPGGTLCLTVPAYQWLFTRHDTLHHHFRRYSKQQLIRLIEAAGLHIEFISYWNFLLFPAAALVRLLDVFNIPKDHVLGAKKPAERINRLLIKLVSFEAALLNYAKLPFGLSLVVLARKP